MVADFAGGATRPSAYHIDPFEQLFPVMEKVTDYAQEMGLDLRVCASPRQNYATKPHHPEARDPPVNLPRPLLRSAAAALSPPTLEVIDVFDAGGRIVLNEAQAAALDYPQDALTGRDADPESARGLSA